MANPVSVPPNRRLRTTAVDPTPVTRMKARSLQERVADMAENSLNAESPGAPAGLGDAEQVCRAVVGAK